VHEVADFVLRNRFLLAMAALEFGQAASDVWTGGHWARTVIMVAAGSSSLAMIWL